MLLDDGARSDVITEILTGVKVKVREREAGGILLALKKGAIGRGMQAVSRNWNCQGRPVLSLHKEWVLLRSVR